MTFNASNFLMDYTDIEPNPEFEIKLSHVERCGAYSSVSRDPYTGKIKRVTFYCKQFRVCKKCAERRMKSLENRFNEIKSNVPNARISVFSDDVWAKSQRMLSGRENFLRFPLDDGKCAVIHRDGSNIHTKAEQSHQFSDMNLNKLAARVYLTPTRKRISGTLGEEKQEDDQSDDDSVSISIRQIHINTDNEKDINEIESKFSKPKGRFSSKDSLQNAIRQCENRFIFWAQKLGYLCSIDHVRKKSINLEQVNWE